MFLVGSSNPQAVNVGVLWGLINGYESALRDRDEASQHEPFKRWVYARCPDLAESSAWYGGELLRRMEGDHEAVVEQIRRWAEEYVAEQCRK